jgi:hypothetical protein
LGRLPVYYGKSSHTWEDFTDVGSLPIYGNSSHVWEVFPYIYIYMYMYIYIYICIWEDLEGPVPLLGPSIHAFMHSCRYRGIPHICIGVVVVVVVVVST